MNDPVIRAIVDPFWKRFKRPEFVLSVDAMSGIEFNSSYDVKGESRSAAPWANVSEPRSTATWTPIYTFYMTILIRNSWLIVRSRAEGNFVSNPWRFDLSDPTSIDKIREKVDYLLKHGG